MKKFAPCTSYKIGFFGLLALIIVLFGLFASSTLLKRTYKNRAEENKLDAVVPEVTDTPKISNTKVLIATISAFIKRDAEEVYDVTFEEVMYKPKPRIKTDQNVISFIKTEDFKIIENQSDPRILTCSFSGETILKPVEIPITSDPTKPLSNEEVIASPETEIVESLIDEKFLSGGYLNHTYTIDYAYDLDVTPNPGHQKQCTITRIEIQIVAGKEVAE